MICVPILGPSFEMARRQIAQVLPSVDLVELRLDHFQALDLEALKSLQCQFPIPMIFTLRCARQGGCFMGSEEKRLDMVRTLATLKPAYLDLENDVPRAFIAEISSLHPEIKLILSHHNFAETPPDLQELYETMQVIPVWAYKIAVQANSTIDGLRLLNWAKNTPGNLIALSMGPYGQLSRILAPFVRSPFTYASWEDHQQSAPGQVAVRILHECYHYKSLTPETALFGLIGDPVEMSISDVTHNYFFRLKGLNAVYIKMHVQPEELGQFLALAKQLPFNGLSVTMPLKECIIPHLEQISSQAKAIGAVNTLLLKNDQWIGSNTDGIGALNALEKEFSLHGKRLVLIGAGGAAKAIAHEAHRRGAIVTIINRDKSRAQKIASQYGFEAKSLAQMGECTKEGYEVLINSTTLDMPIDDIDILPNVLVMDVKTRPKESRLLKSARQKGGKIVYGYQMFVEQALCQCDTWFDGEFSIAENRVILENKALEILR